MKNNALLIALLLFSQLLTAQITVTKHDLSAFHSKPTTRSIAQAADGQMYAVLVDYFYSGDGKVLVKNDGSGWASMTPPCEDCVLEVISTPMGEIWLGTNVGLYQLNADGMTWDLALADTYVSIMHFTPSGKFYFVDRDGLATWDGTNVVTFYGSGTPVTTYVNQIVSDSNDRLLLRNASNPFVFDGTDFEFISDFYLPNSIGVDEQDVYWGASFQEVLYLKDGEWKEDNNLPNVIATADAMIIDRDFNFWVRRGTQYNDGVLYRYNRSLNDLQNIAIKDLDSELEEDWNPAYFLEDRDGDIWLSSSESGVFYELRGQDMTSSLNPALKTIQHLKLSPNPIDDQQISIHMNLIENSTLNIKIINPLGQVIHSFATQDWPSGEHLESLDLPTLTAGVYQLQITTEEGEQMMSSFVKR